MSETFHQRLDRLIEERTTKRKLIDACGICSNSFTVWKKRNNYPSVPNLYKIAKHLGVSMEYLVVGDDGKK